MSRATVAGVARALLGVAGLVVVVLLIRSAGAERVGRVLWQARVWLPVIVALEVYQFGSDYLALRFILGPDRARVPGRTWLRSSVIAYACMILVPAGRAAGEVARATLLSATLGAGRAATASTQLQAAYLGANGIVSLLEYLLVGGFIGWGAPLPLLLAGNFVVQAAISAGLLAILWDARVGRWLDRARKRLLPGAVEAPPVDPAVRRKLPAGALVVCTLARAAQVGQYGVIVLAVGGVLSLQGATVAHGIHLVGSTLGDLVPNQLGVMDGAYRTFASTLGFGAEPARALSITFVVRAAQLLLAASCVLVATLTRTHAAGALRAASPSERVDARS